MKAKYILGAALLAIGLTACENYFDEKYLDNGDPQIPVVKTFDYILTDADYKTIADNKTNKAYAVSLDTVEGQTSNQDALAQVGENRYFNEVATADMYVPAFIYNKYPHLDPGSVFNVTFRTYEGQPAYLDFYNQTIQYTLTAANYKAVWGEWDKEYLTAENEAQLTDFLPAVEDDYLVGVKYNYAETEGEAIVTKEVIYIFKGGYLWQPYTSSEVTLLPMETNGQAIKYLQLTYPYAQKDDKQALMTYDSKQGHYVATEYQFDGQDWIANTGVVEETMSFALSQGWAANLSTYYKQAIAGEGTLGKITLHHYDLEDGITYIWRFDNLYGMRGSAYVSGPHYGEGWFVTPAIRLKNSKQPALSFEHALNYGPNDETRYQQITVWVSTDYVDDARSATWTQLPWNEWNGETGVPDANSWTFYNSGRMDLSPWNGKTVHIGFRYKTEAGQTCPTWEVKNILVNEPQEEE